MEKKNKFGVKVGDIFETSWGYDDTNTNFFQVVKLCGEESVRVREVHLPVLEERRTWGSCTRTCKVVTDILAPADWSLFIKDQKNGDLKRLKNFRRGEVLPQFKVSSYADAWLVRGDTVGSYDSWMR